ncbi:glycosyltransferase family A protein [Flavobacterium sp. NG2]|uniref:glycosyltransferase family 2 protein n=1 Tax=Flavobacterium sp. NG2 TaxID=3097547 RepID=UPI002A7FB287|nr:glycosyltransferase family A protein [Flavobacterium sp. NG2]WPR71609.1 glycosyltransferase family A protein [Flavobacterium sp. NG2]
METSSLVSVIIPCYNHAEFLPEALQSILNQSYMHWECLIVNDGSPDHTEIVAQEWLSKDSRFRYLKKENGGLSSARNYGIKEAKGEYILTLDADDKYEYNFIEKGIGILFGRRDIGLVSSWGVRFIGDSKLTEFKPTGKSIDDFLFRNAAIGTSLFRRECWEQVSGYDENMKYGYEDWEFYIRICLLGWKVHIIEEPLFFYRQHETSMRTTAVKNHDKDIKKYIFLKHKELYIEHFESFVNYFLSRIEMEKEEKIRCTKRLEYKIGSMIVKPLRWFKSLFR